MAGERIYLSPTGLGLCATLKGAGFRKLLPEWPELLKRHIGPGPGPWVRACEGCELCGQDARLLLVLAAGPQHELAVGEPAWKDPRRYIPHPVHAETPLTICCHIPQPSYFESSGKQASTSMLGSCRPGLQKQKRPPLPDAATLPAEMPSKCWGSGFALGL